MQKLTVEHLLCAHRILKYVNGTKDGELLYRHDITEKLVGYTNVDWAGDVSDCRSTSDYMFSLASVVVAWSSKK